MRIARVILDNIGPLGHVDIHLPALAALTGANGKGKSSTSDGITWALWGLSRAKDDDELVRKGHVECAAEVYFSIHGVDYKVERSHRLGKSTKLHFERLNADGTVTNLDGATTIRGENSTQAKIIAALGGITAALATSTTFFLQGQSNSFSTADPAERRRILYGLLGLTRFDVKRKAVEKRRFATEEVLAKADAEVAYHREKAETMAEVTAAKETAEHQAAQAAGRLDDATRHLSAAQAAHVEAREALRTAEAGQGEVDRLRMAASQAQREYEAIRGELEPLETALALPTVGAPTDQEIANLRQAEAEAEAEVTRLRGEYDAATEALSRAKEATSEKRAVYEDAKRAAVAVYDAYRAKGLDAIASAKNALALANEELKALITTAKAEHQRLSSDRAAAVREASNVMELARDKRLRAEGAAALLDRVPCGGEGQYAACGFLTAAGDAKLSLPALVEAEARAVDAHGAAVAALDDVGEYVDSIAVTFGREKVVAHDGYLRQVEAAYTAMPAYVEPEEVAAAGRVAENARITVDRATENLAFIVSKGKPAKIAYDSTRAQREAAENAARNAQAAQVERARQEGRKNALAASLKTKGEEVERLRAELDETERRFYAGKTAAYERVQQTNADLLPLLDEVRGLTTTRNMARDASVRAQAALDDVQRSVEAVAGHEAKVADLRRTAADCARLEQACKDAPTLLFEVVRDEIEARANAILRDLSTTGLSVRLDTQRPTKDGEKLIETLDIVVIGRNGELSYSVYGGGERFRVDVALRLALADVLEQRGAACLQTVIIDEGFGAVDAESLGVVTSTILKLAERFSPLLVISHVAEVTDCFPARLRVVEGENGSTVEVL